MSVVKKLVLLLLPKTKMVPLQLHKMKMVLLLLTKMKMALLMLHKIKMALLLLPKMKMVLLLLLVPRCSSCCCRPRWRCCSAPAAAVQDVANAVVLVLFVLPAASYLRKF